LISSKFFDAILMLTLFRCACGCYEKWVLDYSRRAQPGSYRCSRSTQQGKELCVFPCGSL